MKRILAVLALMVVAACGFIPSIDRDMSGETVSVRGASYDQVWQATESAVGSVFRLRGGDASKVAGEILTGGNGCAYGPGNYLGVYITPVAASAPVYTVKVVADSDGGRLPAEMARTMRDSIASTLQTIPGAEVR